jgi:hypothetical protein
VKKNTKEKIMGVVFNGSHLMIIPGKEKEQKTVRAFLRFGCLIAQPIRPKLDGNGLCYLEDKQTPNGTHIFS